MPPIWVVKCAFEKRRSSATTVIASAVSGRSQKAWIEIRGMGRAPLARSSPVSDFVIGHVFVRVQFNRHLGSFAHDPSILVLGLGLLVGITLGTGGLTLDPLFGDDIAAFSATSTLFGTRTQEVLRIGDH